MRGGLSTHEQAAADAAAEGCLCTGPKPDAICGPAGHPDYSCCRRKGHTGVHVACAGSEGPHAIASWGDVKRWEETTGREWEWDASTA